jgi:hypothetical protein
MLSAPVVREGMRRARRGTNKQQSHRHCDIGCEATNGINRGTETRMLFCWDKAWVKSHLYRKRNAPTAG